MLENKLKQCSKIFKDPKLDKTVLILQYRQNKRTGKPWMTKAQSKRPRILNDPKCAIEGIKGQ